MTQTGISVTKSALLLLTVRCIMAQPSPCALSGDATVSAVDVQLAINQALGLLPCTTANLAHDGCTVVDVQRVINAASGGTCLVTGGSTGTGGVGSGNSVPGTDSLTIYESDGANRTSFPITFGRAFVEGEIPAGACPQPVVGGAPISGGNWQADLKNVWADGSVKYAVLSLILPSLSANGSQTVAFQSGPCNNSGSLAQSQMINFNSGNWGAAINVTANEETVSRDAATMLSYTDPGSNSVGDCKNDYWLQGPVVTAVIVQDCTPSTNWDFGWLWNGSTMADNGGTPYLANCGGTAKCAASLHPWFILYFYPGSNAVRADYILENDWTDRGQDQLINVAYLTGPARSRATALAYNGAPRVLTDVTMTEFSDVITSASANFTAEDVGTSFSHFNAGDTTICSVEGSTRAMLCAPAQVSGTDQTVYLNDWLWGQMYRKTFWTGSGNPGNYLIDHNWPYIVSTGMVAPYDTTKSASPDSPDRIVLNGCGTNSGSDWSCFSGELLTNLGLTQTWSDAGDRGGGGGLDETYSQADGDPTPMSRQALLYLTNMSACGTANGACAKAWWILTGTRGSRDSGLPSGIPGGAGIWNNSGNIAYHMRESRTRAGRYYCPSLADKNALSSATSCGTSAGTPFGRPVSRYYDPTSFTQGGPVGKPLGSKYTYGKWTPVPIRWLEWTYAAYLLTGDYYYALDTQMNGAYVAGSVNSNATDYGSNGFFASMQPAGAILRRSAGTLDAILKARTVSSDGSLEQTYFDSILASNAEVFEGIMSLTGTPLTPALTNPTCTSYSINSSNRWDWGACTLRSYCGRGEPQGNTCTPVAQALHMPASGSTILGINANVNARIFDAGYAVAGPTTQLITWDSSNIPNVGDTLYFSNATGAWIAINGIHIVLATGTTTSNCPTGTCRTVTINANTSGASQPLTGAVVGHWGSFGLITSVTTAANAVLTSTTSPHGYQLAIYGCVDQGGTNWSQLNGLWGATATRNNTFTLNAGFNSATFPAFNQGGCYYSEMGLKQDQTTDIVQGWMEGLLGIVVNEMAGQGVSYFETVASEMNMRLIEKLQDPAYNPYLVGLNIQPVKSPSGGQQLIGLSTTNPYFTTWAAVKAALAPETQAANSFWGQSAWDMGGPCTDHSYSLINRAMAVYVVGLIDTSDGNLSGTSAWNWINANLPYFNYSPPSGDASCGAADTQIKFAFAPL